MSFRIAKYPTLPSFGRDFHIIAPGSIPPPPPAPPNPVPIPGALWFVTIVNLASTLVYGKFTISNSITDGLGDILAGHDWGILQPHIPSPPILFAPNMPLVTLGSSHKYFLPSYAVQETPQGGAMALAGASGSAVAVTTSAFVIPLQDCIESFVAPLGVGFQIPGTRWVGFGFGDIAAGLISMGGDGLGAAVSGSLGNAMSKGLGLSDFGGALLGAALGAVNNTAQNWANANLPGGFAGTAVGYLPMASMIVLGPAAVGLATGRAADAVGGLGHGQAGAADATGVQVVPGETGLTQ